MDQKDSAYDYARYVGIQIMIVLYLGILLSGVKHKSTKTLIYAKYNFLSVHNVGLVYTVLLRIYNFDALIHCV